LDIISVAITFLVKAFNVTAEIVLKFIVQKLPSFWVIFYSKCYHLAVSTSRDWPLGLRGTSLQAHNQLGTPGGAMSFMRGLNF